MPEKHKRLLIILLSSLFLFLFHALPLPAYSQDAYGELFGKEAAIEVTADVLTYDKERNTYVARGNVVISQEGTTLMADEATLNLLTGIASATGDVLVIDEGKSRLEGIDLKFNIKDKTAVVTKARLFYKEENIHITGDTIKKVGPETYDGENVAYTTCDCDVDETPAWNFSASQASVTVGEYLRGWHAFFRVKGVPILYSPYVKIPIKRERQSGFLTPRPGYSKLKGFRIDIPFFWAISKNTDATFDVDIQTERGLGKGLEFRYIRSRRSYGELSIFHFKEKDIERLRDFRKDVDNLSRPEDASDDRWQFRMLHTEFLPLSVNFKANVHLVSDDEYLIDFAKASDQKSLESIETNLSLSRSWSAYSLVAQLRTFDNLLLRDDSATLQKLPEVSLTASDQKILSTPFYVSAASSLIYFYREEGIRGERLDVQPRLSLPLSPGGYFELTPSFAPRATFYLINRDPGGRYFERYLYDAKVDLTTTFARVYQTAFEHTDALRHTVRPKLSYTYIPEAVQSDLPQFDGVDSIAATNTLTYSVNTTLTGRSVNGAALSYHDYLYMDLSQSYDLNEATRKLPTPLTQRRPLSDISGEIILKPSSLSNISGKGKYNVYDDWFTSYDASLSVSDARGDSLSLSHRFLRGGTRYMEGGLRVRINEALQATYSKRFSFTEYRSLETTYALEYTHQCWSSVLSYSERLEEKVFYLTFDLLGLGRVAGIQGRVEP